MDVTKLYEFVRFGAMNVSKPYEIYKVWGHGCHQITYICMYIYIYVYIYIYIDTDRHRPVAGGRALAKPSKFIVFGDMDVDKPY